MTDAERLRIERVLYEIAMKLGLTDVAKTIEPPEVTERKARFNYDNL
jgi:hypothetical protein